MIDEWKKENQKHDSAWIQSPKYLVNHWFSRFSKFYQTAGKKNWNLQPPEIGNSTLLMKKIKRFSRSNRKQLWGFPMIYWTNFRITWYHNLVSPLIVNYLICWTFRNFLWGEQTCQFLGVADFNVFAGGSVEQFHDGCEYQKQHTRYSFSRSFQWCNPYLATMLCSTVFLTIQTIDEKLCTMESWEFLSSM